MQKATLAPLTARDDLLSLKRQYALELTYSFTMDTNGEVVPRATRIHDVRCLHPFMLVSSRGVCSTALLPPINERNPN